MKKSLFFIILFMRTNKTTDYICPFKTNDIKIETIFSWKMTIKGAFP